MLTTYVKYDFVLSENVEFYIFTYIYISKLTQTSFFNFVSAFFLLKHKFVYINCNQSNLV